MKNTQFILYVSALLLINCGGTEGKKDRVMEIGELYSVSKGDVIVKASSKALIKIVHSDGKENSTVSLLEGNATITHPRI